MNAHHRKTFFIQATKIVLYLSVGAILILWAWNNTITTIFGLPEIHFKESIGLIILGSGLSFIFRTGKHTINRDKAINQESRYER